MPKREDNLMDKIAALLEKPVEELKKQKALYTEEEAVLEAQSVLNYYHWRKELVQGKDESDAAFDRRQHFWRYKTCEGCKSRFAYSFHYDGVKYCSLDCLRVALNAIGLDVTYGRPLMKRWGLTYPGIVPSAALSLLQQQTEDQSHPASSSVEETHVAS